MIERSEFDLNLPSLSSIWETLSRGGLVMYPLYLCSIISLGIIIERFINLRNSKFLPPQLLKTITELLNRRAFQEAQAVCESYSGPFSNLMRYALEARNLGINQIREILRDAGRQEVSSLERYLPTLATIASISPLLGFLGTVTGMIKIFGVISAAGGIGQATSLSGGISEALLTTAAGLSIAIPTVVMYNFFHNRAQSILLQIESFILRFFMLLEAPDKSE